MKVNRITNKILTDFNKVGKPQISIGLSDSGKEMSVEEIVAEVVSRSGSIEDVSINNYVYLTDELLELIEALSDKFDVIVYVNDVEPKFDDLVKWSSPSYQEKLQFTTFYIQTPLHIIQDKNNFDLKLRQVLKSHLNIEVCFDIDSDIYKYLNEISDLKYYHNIFQINDVSNNLWFSCTDDNVAKSVINFIIKGKLNISYNARIHRYLYTGKEK